MKSQQLVKTWFEKWATGDFENIPVTENFCHTSPFDRIKGKAAYLETVQSNKDKFLGYRFEIEDAIYGETSAAVRYIAQQGDFRLEVSEWFYFENDLIREIVAYYHIGEIREERKLK